jgi:hypothetical protein
MTTNEDTAVGQSYRGPHFAANPSLSTSWFHAGMYLAKDAFCGTTPKYHGDESPMISLTVTCFPTGHCGGPLVGHCDPGPLGSDPRAFGLATETPFPATHQGHRQRWRATAVLVANGLHGGTIAHPPTHTA